jgi:phospholipid/cholesterol/gamma-HCH transport system substrate-binding protein
MKISNESKVGALTAIAIAFLILGFNFLKGKSLFKTGNFLYAKYADTKKLKSSDPVYINGFQVGTVYETESQDVSLSKIVVSVKLAKPYNIPDNSVATIESDPLGSSSVVITLGNSSNFLKSGDTIASASNPGLLSALSNKIGPVADQLRATLATLDSVLQNANSVFDPKAKGNLQSTFANLNKATASIVNSTKSLEDMLSNENGSLAQSLQHVDSFTKNLADNNEKITNTLANVEKTTDHLAKADIDGVVNHLKTSVDSLNAMMAKINSTDGTLGSLINDKTLYNEITNTTRSLNILMDDLRVHPKRYVNISVFGKKDKGNYLTAPLNDSASTTQPKK